MVITGQENTIRSYDANRDSMYFILNKTLIEERRRKLVQALHIDGLIYEDIAPYYNYQLEATLGILAKGLPIFEINADGRIPQVQYKGRVQEVKIPISNQHAIIGCGHFAKAVQNPELYKVNGERLKEAMEYLKEKINQ